MVCVAGDFCSDGFVCGDLAGAVVGVGCGFGVSAVPGVTVTFVAGVAVGFGVFCVLTFVFVGCGMTTVSQGMNGLFGSHGPTVTELPDGGGI